MKAKTKPISFSVSIILILTLILSFPMAGHAAEIDSAPTSSTTEYVTLYVIEDWATSYMSIPDSYPQSYQINTDNLVDPTFTSLDPKGVSVSESGLITPAVTYTYWYGYNSYPEPLEDKTPTRITSAYSFEGGEIKVDAKNRTYYIRVNVVDYAAVYAKNVDLYYLSSDYSSFISIPSDYPHSYQFPTNGMSDPQIRSLDPWDVTVENGVATLVKRTWYYYGNVGYSSPIQGKEPDRIKETVSDNGGYVTVSANGKTELYHINAVNYAKKYTEDVMREYLDQNITPSMTTRDKVDAIARFVANRKYDYHYSNAVDMVVTGGGDCWASTATIVQMAQMIGLQSWRRNGNKDYGAGSGHANAMVFDGTDYYEVEAGYNMDTPRYYSIEKRDSLFSIRNRNEGVEVYQYDDVPDNLTDTFEIPSEINGKPVVSIGKYFCIGHCLESTKRVESIVIPDTVTSIGEGAFIYCGTLKEITIPASVTSIGNNAFAYYVNQDIYGDTDNEKFIIRGYKGTAAETYAKENGMTFVEIKRLLGDVDGNEDVTIADATYILRHEAGIDTPCAVTADFADVNRDGEITIMDATLIQKWLSNITVNCKIGEPI